MQATITLQQIKYYLPNNFRFNVTVSDRPGGVSELCKLLADIGVSIKDLMHERAWINDIHSVEVCRTLAQHIIIE